LIELSNGDKEINTIRMKHVYKQEVRVSFTTNWKKHCVAPWMQSQV